jgi:hypothetical protein
MACIRASLVFTTAVALLVPDVALARRREPAPAEAPVAAQPVAPAPAAAPAPAVAPPPAAAPAVVVVTPAAAPPPATEPPAVVFAPAPAPTVSPSTPMPAPSRPPFVPSNARANALLGSGLGVLGGVYFFTSLSGAIIIDRARDGKYDETTGLHTGPDERRMKYGRGLLVPVVGPFISLAYTDSARERWAASISGLAQVSGAVLTIAGIVAKGRIRRAQRLGWTAGGTQGGGMVALHGRF